MMLAVVFMIAVLPSVLSGADTRRRDLLEQIRAGTRVAFLQSIQVQRSWEHAMTYRIERSTTHRGVTFLVSERHGQPSCRRARGAYDDRVQSPRLLDLADVTLVNRGDGVSGTCGHEMTGASSSIARSTLCSWIDTEHGNA